MASHKENDRPPVRPSPVHRASSSTTGGTAPLAMPSSARHAPGRAHAHSVSLGTWHASPRVTRRKSLNSNGFAALAARGGLDGAFLESLALSAAPPRPRPHSVLHPNNATPHLAGPGVGGGETHGAHIRPEGPAQGRAEGAVAIVDAGRPLSELGPGGAGVNKTRNRRASDGGHLPKTEGKRVSTGELRCEKCGKGYKHSSCLTKHLWEHTPEWSYTSKLLISKHQQVQLLEAATVLVGMNKDGPAPAALPASAAAPLLLGSGHSSASPLPSGSSEIASEELSSAETTPPPTSSTAPTDLSGPPSAREIRDPAAAQAARHHRRSTATSSLYSRSYGGASPPAPGSLASSIPTSSSAHGSFRQGGFHGPANNGGNSSMGGVGGGGYYPRRPSTSASSAYGGPGLLEEDEAGLAAAVELCHFGTPRTGPVGGGALGADIPPVPPLPAQYAGASRPVSGVPFAAQHGLGAGAGPPQPPPLMHRGSDERDVKMRDCDEEDVGIFGRMEP